jgi:Rab11 family-interacting protein 3/4
MASSIDQEPLQSPIEQLKNIFDLCDQDHDGYITVDEFRSLGQEYLGGVSQIDILVNEMDPDNSGVITFNSFRKGIEQYLISRSDSVSSTSHTSIEDGGSESSPFSPSGVIYDQANIPDIITYISSLDDSFHHQYDYHPEGTDHNDDVIMNGLRVKESSGHSSYNDINIQPSDVSPSMMAKSLMKRSNHSLLQMSNGGTPDWTFDEDNDELTDKLQELSTRLEALEVDLDCSQTETLRLKRENMALRER